VEAHGVVRCRGSHIFSRQSAYRWRWGCQHEKKGRRHIFVPQGNFSSWSEYSSGRLRCHSDRLIILKSRHRPEHFPYDYLETGPKVFVWFVPFSTQTRVMLVMYLYLLYDFVPYEVSQCFICCHKKENISLGTRNVTFYFRQSVLNKTYISCF
jgi:hypothetical protein